MSAHDQLTIEDVKGMSAVEITEAEKAGRLDQLLGRPPKPSPSEADTVHEAVRRMTPAEVVRASQETTLVEELRREREAGVR